MIPLVQSLISRSGFSSSDTEEFTEHLRGTLGATEFDLPNRQAAELRHSFIKFRNLQIGSFSFGTPAKIKFPPHEMAILGLPAKGQGLVAYARQTAITTVARPTLVSPGQPLELQYGADLEKLFIRFDSELLERKLASLLGGPASRKLKFDLVDFTSPEAVQSLTELVRALVRQISDRRLLISPVAVCELEEVIAVQLLFAGRHQFSDRLHRKPLEASSGPVAAAEQFIEANWSNPITVEALAEVTGVSVRTLHRSFLKTKGYSPMAFARKIRLEQARKLLREPDDDTSVTGVALVCGFANLGRFAHDYWNMFGELPSETLRLKKS